MHDAELVVRASSDPVRPLNDLAWDYIKMGQYQKAIALASEVAGRLAGEPVVLDTLGWALFQSGEIERAEGHLREAITLDSAFRLGDGSSEIRFHFVSVLLKNRKRPEALKVWHDIEAQAVDNEWVGKIRALLTEDQ